jgi:Crp-like helix-turn-helix domain
VLPRRWIVELGKYGGQDDGAGHLVLRHKISQGDLAAMAGVARENVSRVIADWKRNKVIARSSGFYCLIDIATLQRNMDWQAERRQEFARAPRRKPRLDGAQVREKSKRSDRSRATGSSAKIQIRRS